MITKIGTIITAVLIGASIYAHNWSAVAGWTTCLLTELQLIELKRKS